MRTFLVALLVAASAACSSFSGVDDPSASPEAGVPETGAADASAADGASTPDGGGADPGCTILVSDDFSSPNPGWVSEGVASFTNGVALLVTPEKDKTGAIFFAVPPPLNAVEQPTSFKARFTFIDATPGQSADGISLVWASDLTLPPLGGTGMELGFCPNATHPTTPKGAALGLHVSAPIQASLQSSNGVACTGSVSQSVTFTGRQIVDVTVTGAAVTAHIGSTTFPGSVGTPVPLRWIGLVGATGGAAGNFSVDDVTIQICR